MTPEIRGSVNVVRHLYIDEAGIGNPDTEPYTVVAGFLMHVDGQYHALSKYLLDMADDLVAPNLQRPEDFHFHAKDIWHGSGFFRRSDWPLEKRLKILGHLADIPKLFELPIIYTCLKRDEVAPGKLTRKQRAVADKKTHSTCFLGCLRLADDLIERDVPGEQVFAVVEHHQAHRSGLQTVAETMANPRYRKTFEESAELIGVQYHPLKHFVETPLFAQKSGSSPLQVADTCAFILARALAGGNHIDELLEKIKPQLVTGFRNRFFKSPDQILKSS